MYIYVFFLGQDLYMIGGEYLLGYGNWNQSIWKYDVIREMWNFETRYHMHSECSHHIALVCVISDIRT
jgi:hypothetical protein